MKKVFKYSSIFAPMQEEDISNWMNKTKIVTNRRWTQMCIMYVTSRRIILYVSYFVPKRKTTSCFADGFAYGTID